MTRPDMAGAGASWWLAPVGAQECQQHPDFRTFQVFPKDLPLRSLARWAYSVRGPVATGGPGHAGPKRRGEADVVLHVAPTCRMRVAVLGVLLRRFRRTDPADVRGHTGRRNSDRVSNIALAMAIGPRGRISTGLKRSSVPTTICTPIDSSTRNRCFAAVPPTLSKRSSRSKMPATDTLRMSGTRG